MVWRAHLMLTARPLGVAGTLAAMQAQQSSSVGTQQLWWECE